MLETASSLVDSGLCHAEPEQGPLLLTPQLTARLIVVMVVGLQCQNTTSWHVGMHCLFVHAAALLTCLQ